MRAMFKRIVALSILAASPAFAQSAQDEARFRQAQDRFQRELDVFQQEFDRYQSLRGGRGGYAPAPNGAYRNAPDRYDPAYDDGAYYDPAQDYRSGPQYRERVLATNDRVYRGEDGRYYCKRTDGTTGLIVGAAGGGILGNVIDGGRSRTVGTLLGGAIGALAGREIERNQSEIRCR
jgi:hypothetical protein